ncbi:unnamed protein product [Acanthoscelides obtectus]|uniref:Uncharacterized protein n=1 Tax=Acanthoscelides obtectus TaxID=200917 RepID=A0A9P0NXU9_ACAOB|nr:unnamed protein product [Acanthoscelides obtectus]CAK1642864.1 hypothetical protein AOBTE_LOCUS13250 [Acanthoscelides obtectus]
MWNMVTSAISRQTTTTIDVAIFHINVNAFSELLTQ